MRATYSTKHHMTEMTGPMENWNGLANMEQRTNLEVTACDFDIMSSGCGVYLDPKTITWFLYR